MWWMISACVVSVERNPREPQEEPQEPEETQSVESEDPTQQQDPEDPTAAPPPWASCSAVIERSYDGVVVDGFQGATYDALGLVVFEYVERASESVTQTWIRRPDGGLLEYERRVDGVVDYWYGADYGDDDLVDSIETDIDGNGTIDVYDEVEYDDAGRMIEQRSDDPIGGGLDYVYSFHYVGDAPTWSSIVADYGNDGTIDYLSMWEWDGDLWVLILTDYDNDGEVDVQEAREYDALDRLVNEFSYDVYSMDETDYTYDGDDPWYDSSRRDFRDYDDSTGSVTDRVPTYDADERMIQLRTEYDQDGNGSVDSVEVADTTWYCL